MFELNIGDFYFRQGILGSVVLDRYVGDDKEVNIPSEVEYEGKKYSVAVISSGAFEECNNLESVIIPNSVFVISNDAFKGCCSLAEVKIPENCSYIANSAFDKDVKIIIPESNCHLFILNDLVYTICGIDVEVIGYRGRETELEIPSKVEYKEEVYSVTSIWEFAFDMDCDLKSITIPNSVTTIENYAFNLSDVESITIPNSVIEIGIDIFNGCDYLKYINDTYIGDFTDEELEKFIRDLESRSE